MMVEKRWEHVSCQGRLSARRERSTVESRPKRLVCRVRAGSSKTLDASDRLHGAPPRNPLCTTWPGLCHRGQPFRNNKRQQVTVTCVKVSTSAHCVSCVICGLGWNQVTVKQLRLYGALCTSRCTGSLSYAIHCISLELIPLAPGELLRHGVDLLDDGSARRAFAARAREPEIEKDSTYGQVDEDCRRRFISRACLDAEGRSSGVTSSGTGRRRWSGCRSYGHNVKGVEHNVTPGVDSVPIAKA